MRMKKLPVFRIITPKISCFFKFVFLCRACPALTALEKSIRICLLHFAFGSVQQCRYPNSYLSFISDCKQSISLHLAQPFNTFYHVFLVLASLFALSFLWHFSFSPITNSLLSFSIFCLEIQKILRDFILVYNIAEFLANSPDFISFYFVFASFISFSSELFF